MSWVHNLSYPSPSPQQSSTQGFLLARLEMSYNMPYLTFMPYLTHYCFLFKNIGIVSY